MPSVLSIAECEVSATLLYDFLNLCVVEMKRINGRNMTNVDGEMICFSLNFEMNQTDTVYLLDILTGGYHDRIHKTESSW
jgi:hypothetical protein